MSGGWRYQGSGEWDSNDPGHPPFGTSPDHSEPARDWTYHCWHCMQSAAHSCLLQDHIVQYLATPVDAPAADPASNMDEVPMAGSSAIATGSSGSAWEHVFAPGGSTQASWTRTGSSLGSSEMATHDLSRGTASSSGNHGANDRFAYPNLPSNAPIPHGPETQNGTHQNLAASFNGVEDSVGDVQPSNAHRMILEYYRQRWQARNHTPDQSDIESIAHLEGLAVDVVRSWFSLNLTPHLQQIPSTTSTSPSPSGAGNRPLMEVMRHARGRFNAPCNQRYVRESGMNALYKCTSHGCEYSTDHRDAWQRHEQLWQPQHFWHCIVCRRNGEAPTILSRKDKIGEHLRVVHGATDADVDRLRDESKVDFEAGFETHCKFFDGRQCCSYKFTSWDDRIEHYLAHFHDRVRHGPWELRYGRHSWFDDGDEDYDRGSHRSTTCSGHTKLPVMSNHTHSSSGHCSGGSSGKHLRYAGSVVDTAEKDSSCGGKPELKPTNHHRNSRPSTEPPLVECSTLHGSIPHTLIDVGSKCLVQPPENAKYLALDHTIPRSDDASASAISIIKSSDTQVHNVHIEHLPIAMEKAVSLAKEFGYQYLWIAELCERPQHGSSHTSIFERAALVIIPFKTQQHGDQLWHFTGQYRNLQQVRTWAKQDMSFLHIQNLGHGTYGIVDEVVPQSNLVTPRLPSLARKELLTVPACTRSRVAHLQEIDIMQKLNHPHIARFVAAYYEHERRSLNILMTPVAQCDLRYFLSEPTCWPGNKHHLAKWYKSLASALYYLHNISVRHKDIKPANILISGNEVLLSDFGTSQQFSADNSGSYGGAFMTPKYCAPEVAAKRRRGRKADVFSLGCVFAEMITVELGQTLQSLHKFLNPDQQKRSHDITYHSRLPHLVAWLSQLQHKARLLRQKALLQLCKVMIAFDPTCRPSARKVYEALCAHLSLDHNLIATACLCPHKGESRAPHLSKTVHDGRSSEVKQPDAFSTQDLLDCNTCGEGSPIIPLSLCRASQTSILPKDGKVMFIHASTTFLSISSPEGFQTWRIDAFDVAGAPHISLCSVTMAMCFVVSETLPHSCKVQSTPLRAHCRTYILVRAVVQKLDKLRGRHRATQTFAKLSLKLLTSILIRMLESSKASLAKPHKLINAVQSSVWELSKFGE